MPQEHESLGRLSVLGVDELWQVPMLLPRRWLNLVQISDRLPYEAIDEARCLVLRVTSAPKKHKGTPPRLTFRVADAIGKPGQATVWGSGSEIVDSVKEGRRAAIVAKISFWRGSPELAVSEVVEPRWLGHMRPEYSGKTGVIGPELVRSRVIAALPEAIPLAADKLRERLREYGDEAALLKLAGAEAASLERLLWTCHLPPDESAGREAHQAIERLAALDMLHQARNQQTSKPTTPIRLSEQSLSRRIAAIPFALTNEQLGAIHEATEDLRRPVAMRRLLTGDVGTGKTAVYGATAAAAADAGAKVAIMLPGVPLAAQVAREIQEWWPDLDVVLVEAGAKRESKKAYAGAQIVVGTTALLTAKVGERDLMIVDEQQKFSRKQREKLASSHLLEVSATCIPRSQALVEFGVLQVSRLTKGHVEKSIHTKIRGREERGEIFRDCLANVKAGHQVAIVYPLMEKSSKSATADKEDSDEKKTIKAASDAALAWEKHCPGRVRVIHGQMKDDEKREALNDMKADRADVLIATTVIEVGVTLPRLRHLLVVDAERHGLTTLHQLRGRLARHGGEGWCDLYLSRKVPDKILERLSILEQTTDGYAIAEHDLLIRGFGELPGTRQTGRGNGFLIGRAVDMQRLADVAGAIVGIKEERPAPIPWADETTTAPARRPAPVEVDPFAFFDDLERFVAGVSPATVQKMH